MGLRGPAPTPTPLLKARNSLRAEQRNTEPFAAVEAPDCPEWLKGEARKEWFRIVPVLIARRTIAMADRGMLAGMCEFWGQFVSAKSKISGKKPVSMKGVHPIDHPRIVMSMAWKEYSKAAVQFGLSPAAKARVASTPEAKKEKPKPAIPILKIAE